MKPEVFSGSMIVGLCLFAAGAWLRFGPATGLIVGGLGVCVVTIIVVRVCGRA